MRLRLLVGIPLALAGCRNADPAADPAAVVQVKTAVAAIQPFEDKVGSIGTVTVHSGHFASLSAPAPARITTVYVSVGQKVSVGTPLIAFEQTPFITAAQSAEAALAAAQRAYDRARRLADAGIVPT
jgi:multidrug efflux pump subunit AcrA (membrane-fusion protein)